MRVNDVDVVVVVVVIEIESFEEASESIAERNIRVFFINGLVSAVLRLSVSSAFSAAFRISALTAAAVAAAVVKAAFISGMALLSLRTFLFRKSRFD